MLKQHRCFICTLSFPWKHFESLGEAYNHSSITGHSKLKNQDKTFGTNKSSIRSKSTTLLSPQREKPKRVQSKFLKKGDGILPGVGLKIDPEKEQKVIENKLLHKQIMEEFEQNNGPQRIRIQKGPGKYEVITIENGMTLKDMDKNEQRRQQRKEDKERWKQLEKLMKYREEKLKKDQKMIKKEK